MKYDYKNFVLPPDQVLREQLSPEQYNIAYEGGTEPPFQNAYYDNKAPGLYVDAISKYPLFASFDKYDSGTGWPSFTRALPGTQIIEEVDNRFGMRRIALTSPTSGAHLGHLFDDGPREAGGKRYCLNSAVLEFIPLEALEAYGYGEFLPLFNMPI